MGQLIDISATLTQRRDRQYKLDIRERIILQMTRCYIQVTKREMLKRMMVLCDKASEKSDVEEACEALSVLNTVLDSHREDLKTIEISRARSTTVDV